MREVKKINDSSISNVVIILGNGFDLDFDFVTSYQNFVDNDYFKTMLGGDIPFGLIIEDKDAEKMLIYPNGLANYIVEFKEHNNWVDLEICIKEYIKAHRTDKDNITLAKELYALRFFMYHFITKAYCNRIKYETLEKRNKNVAYILMQSIAKSVSNWDIWTFNYTFTCEYLLDKLKVNNDTMRKHIHHIHGNILEQTDSTDIVLGCEYDKSIMSICPDAIKSQWKNYRELRKTYNEQVALADHIIIMGHSVGETDAPYFRCILENPQLKSLTILTNNQSSLNNIKSNLDIVTNGVFGRKMEDATLCVYPFMSYEKDGYNSYYENVENFGISYTSDDSVRKLQSLLAQSGL